jgi:hypothetical protein
VTCLAPFIQTNHRSTSATQWHFHEKKLKYLFSGLIVFPAFIGLANCTHEGVNPDSGRIAPNTSSADAPYLMTLPLHVDGQYFTPRFFSGNSEILFGNATNSFAAWTKVGGLVPVVGKTPSPYNFFLEFSNYDGSILVGGFTYPYNRFKLTDYGLLRWTKAGGFEMLTPNLPPPPADGIDMQSIRISDEGTRISFLCEDKPDFASVACDLQPLPDPAPAAEKMWTEGNGIENLGTAFGRKYDYARVSEDF